MVKSNQRITKIKRDPIEELLKKAEATPVENACTIQPQGMDLTPYPDMNNLRLWTNNYLLNGINATYINNIDASGQTYLTTIVDGLPLFTKLTKSSYLETGLVDFNQPTLDSNGVIGGASFAVTASSEISGQITLSSYVTKVGNPTIDVNGLASNFSDLYQLQYGTELGSIPVTFSGNNITLKSGIPITTPNGTFQYTSDITYRYTFKSERTIFAYKDDSDENYYNMLAVHYGGSQPATNPKGQIAWFDNNVWKLISAKGEITTFSTPLITPIAKVYLDGQTVKSIDYESFYKIPSEAHDAFNATNSTNGYWQSSDTDINPYIIYYYPSKIKPTKIEFNNNTCSDADFILTSFDVFGSNDDNLSDWVLLGSFSNSHTTIDNTTYSFNLNTEYSYKYLKVQSTSSDYTKQIGYMKIVGTVESSQVPVEITKPGLWLSNLCKPYQVSYAGGWLRQNLINHSNKEFDTLNSDTIGNYSFSFFQRGIIHRDAGSTHADNDSYCQHWSPSALGCISHDSIIIPTNNLRNTYTSYQTLAVPSDVNMQYYSETPSKDVEFTFVDNNDNIPLTTTSFNGRVVGDGWTFEYLVSGNHQGSGTWTPDAGCDCDAETVNCEECPHCWSCVSEDIRNSGLCITGEIKYQNADGTVCIQAVNECFQTIQASLQPDNPNKGNNTLSTYEVVGYKVTNGCRRYKANEPGAPTEIICDYGLPYCGSDKGCSSAMIGCPSGTYGANWAEWEITGSLTGYSIVGINGNFSPENYIDSGSSYCDYAVKPGGGIRKGYVQVAVRYYGVSEEQIKQPQSNVNVYFCVTDEKKKQEAQGIPWNYTCGLVDRFSFSFSTTRCEDAFTKSYLVAENISISALGDITGFNEN